MLIRQYMQFLALILTLSTYEDSSMFAIINLTPHSVTVYSTDDVTEVTKGSYTSLILKEGAQPLVTYPSQGVARAASVKEQIDTINGIPVYATSYGEPEGLPPAREGTFYLVSALTAQAAPERHDLLIIDGAVRNAEGQIVGCTAFGRV